MNLLLAARYLQSHFADGVHLVWGDSDNPIVGKINIVAPWLLGKIEFHENREHARELHDLDLARYPFRDCFDVLMSRESYKSRDPNGMVVSPVIEELLVSRT